MARIYQQGFEIEHITDDGYSELDTGSYMWEDINIFIMKGQTGSGMSCKPGRPGGLGKYSFCHRLPLSSSILSDRHRMQKYFKAGYTDLYFRLYYCCEQWTQFYDYELMGGRDSEGSGKIFSIPLKFHQDYNYLEFYNKGELIHTEKYLPYNTWNKLDIHIKLASTGGVFEARLNDKEIFSKVGDTKGTFDEIWSMTLGCFYSWDGEEGMIDGWRYATNIYYDDLAVNDTSGNFNNSWCGNGSILTLKPISNGSSTQFTPMEGTQNFENVDDVPPDGEKTYNYTDVVGSKDLFNMEKLDVSQLAGRKINAVTILTQGKCVENGMALQQVIKNGTNEVVMEPFALANSYLVDVQKFNVSPFTNQLFTPSELNATEFGYKTLLLNEEGV